MVSSKGFGKQFVEENRDKIIKDGFITFQGTRYSLPRYYRELLGKDFQKKYTRTAIENQKKQKENFFEQNRDNEVYLREFGNLETAYFVMQRRSARAKNENIKRRQELSSHKEKF